VHTCWELHGPASVYLKAGEVVYTRRHVRASAWWRVVVCDRIDSRWFGLFLDEQVLDASSLTNPGNFLAPFLIKL
jgi:hypothetical protein